MIGLYMDLVPRGGRRRRLHPEWCRLATHRVHTILPPTHYYMWALEGVVTTPFDDSQAEYGHRDWILPLQIMPAPGPGRIRVPDLDTTPP